ncbi:MAG: AbrB/MazE/SpoVT family DNA-binding domain-containing protein [Gammaproteobacteria bacterium]
MLSSTLTQKGQVTIPVAYRQALNLEAGDSLEFKQSGDFLILRPVKKNNVMDLYGFLPKPKKALSIDQINEIIESKHS